MAKNLGVFRLLISLVFLASLSGIRIVAQEHVDDSDDPSHGFTRGPISLTSLVGARSEIQGTDDFNGCKVQHFHLSASGGRFSYTVPHKLALMGQITALDLAGARSFVDECRSAIFISEKEKFTLTVSLTQATTFAVFGGTITLPRGASLSIHNGTRIEIVGASQTGQQGSLSFGLGNVSLSQAVINYPGLDMHLAVSLKAMQPIDFSLPLALGQLVIAKGQFSGGLAPPAHIGQIVNISTDQIQASLTSVLAPRIIFSIAPTTTIHIGGLQAKGQAVASIDPQRHLPVLLSGILTVADVSAVAPYSALPITLTNPSCTGVVLRPIASGVVPDPLRPTPLQRQYLQKLTLADEGVFQQQAILAATEGLHNRRFDMFSNITANYARPYLVAEAAKIHVQPLDIAFANEELLALVSPVGAALGGGEKYILRAIPSVVGTKLVLQYSVVAASISSYRQVKKELLSSLIENLRDEVDQIADAADQPGTAAQFDIPMSFVKPLNTHYDHSEPTYSIHVVSSATSVTTTITDPVILIDSDGIHVLASLGVQ